MSVCLPVSICVCVVCECVCVCVLSSPLLSFPLFIPLITAHPLPNTLPRRIYGLTLYCRNVSSLSLFFFCSPKIVVAFKKKISSAILQTRSNVRRGSYFQVGYSLFLKPKLKLGWGWGCRGFWEREGVPKELTTLHQCCERGYRAILGKFSLPIPPSLPLSLCLSLGLLMVQFLWPNAHSRMVPQSALMPWYKLASLYAHVEAYYST